MFSRGGCVVRVTCMAATAEWRQPALPASSTCYTVTIIVQQRCGHSPGGCVVRVICIAATARPTATGAATQLTLSGKMLRQMQPTTTDTNWPPAALQVTLLQVLRDQPQPAAAAQKSASRKILSALLAELQCKLECDSAGLARWQLKCREAARIWGSPKKLRGWLSFDSGTANSSTAEAPKVGFSTRMSMPGTVYLCQIDAVLMKSGAGTSFLVWQRVELHDNLLGVLP